MLPPFANEPFTDFSREENRKAAEKALALVRSRFGEHGRLLVDGKWIERKETFASLDPSTADRVIAHVSKASPQDVEKAIVSAGKAFQSWRHAPAQERAGYLLKAAAAMRRR